MVLGGTGETVNGGGMAFIDSTTAFAGALVNGTAGGTTTLKITTGGTATLSANDSHLTDMNYSTLHQLACNMSTETLTVTDGTLAANIKFIGGYTLNNFQIQGSDGHTGSLTKLVWLLTDDARGASCAAYLIHHVGQIGPPIGDLHCGTAAGSERRV